MQSTLVSWPAQLQRGLLPMLCKPALSSAIITYRNSTRTRSYLIKASYVQYNTNPTGLAQHPPPFPAGGPPPLIFDNLRQFNVTTFTMHTYNNNYYLYIIIVCIMCRIERSLVFGGRYGCPEPTTRTLYIAR